MSIRIRGLNEKRAVAQIGPHPAAANGLGKAAACNAGAAEGACIGDERPFGRPPAISRRAAGRRAR